jgi:hypothetical protein
MLAQLGGGAVRRAFLSATRARQALGAARVSPIEHVTVNQEAPGSIPGAPTRLSGGACRWFLQL